MGAAVGAAVGTVVGANVGASEGVNDGEGAGDGEDVGAKVEFEAGVSVGVADTIGVVSSVVAGAIVKVEVVVGISKGPCVIPGMGDGASSGMTSHPVRQMTMISKNISITLRFMFAHPACHQHCNLMIFIYSFLIINLFTCHRQLIRTEMHLSVVPFRCQARIRNHRPQALQQQVPSASDTGTVPDTSQELWELAQQKSPAGLQFVRPGDCVESMDPSYGVRNGYFCSVIKNCIITQP